MKFSEIFDRAAELQEKYPWKQASMGSPEHGMCMCAAFLLAVGEPLWEKAGGPANYAAVDNHPAAKWFAGQLPQTSEKEVTIIIYSRNDGDRSTKERCVQDWRDAASKARAEGL